MRTIITRTRLDRIEVAGQGLPRVGDVIVVGLDTFLVLDLGPPLRGALGTTNVQAVLARADAGGMFPPSRTTPTP